jgi:hypothetical protein
MKQNEKKKGEGTQTMKRAQKECNSAQSRANRGRVVSRAANDAQLELQKMSRVIVS